MKKATQQQTKEHNRNLVLQMVFEHENISRAEISRLTSLTRTTVSDLVAELIDERLVAEVGIGESQGGKSPILLSLVKDARYVIGLDLAHDQFHGAIVNLRGEICETVTLPILDWDSESALAAVYRILDQLTQSSFQPLVGIGVGTPGLVNTNEGIVINAVNLEWKDLPLAHLLRSRYNLPVFVMNDSQAAALGEYTYGAGHRSEDNLIVINVGHGIGSGIIINGRLFQGDGGGAGEIGHLNVVRSGGILCRCGNRGCLETVANARAVLRDAQTLTGATRERSDNGEHHGMSLDSLKQAYDQGDPLARQVINDAGYFMGLAISSLIGTLNIHKIVLVGEMTCFGKSWLDVIAETLPKTALAGLAKNTRVEIGQLGENGVILGASALLLKDYSLLFSRE
jgi:glucokinase-like ROK family protein